MNIIIHQVKSWLRSIYSWMHEQNIERYLDEYSYRLNRSIHKQNIFDNLIIRMMNHKHIGLQRIKISTKLYTSKYFNNILITVSFSNS
jgi:hypothetical protein